MDRRYVYSSYYLVECVHCMERHYGKTEKRTGAVVEVCTPTSSADGGAVNYIICGHRDNILTTRMLNNVAGWPWPYGYSDLRWQHRYTLSR